MNRELGLHVDAGEGLDLASKPTSTRPEQVDALWCLRFLRAIRDVTFATADGQGLPAERTVAKSDERR